MLLTERDHIFLAHQRLPACEDVHISSQFLPLGDNGIQFLKSKVQPVSVLCSPAACTVHIAGGSGIQKDLPWHIAVFLFRHRFLSGTSHKAGIYNKIMEKCISYAFVQLPYLHDQFVPVIFLFNGMVECLSLGLIPPLRGHFIYHVQKLRDVCLRILPQVLPCF